MSAPDTSTPTVLALAGLADGVWKRLRDGERFVMRVPAQPGHDMDLILSRAARTMGALAAERDALRERLRLAEAALSRAAGQFDFYEQQHRAKGTEDGARKAEVNREMAAMCRAAQQGSAEG